MYYKWYMTEDNKHYALFISGRAYLDEKNICMVKNSTADNEPFGDQFITFG